MTLYLYMRYIEPKMLIVKEYPIINQKIPKSFNGFKIVHFSDIHYGKTTNEKELTKVIEKINILKPDILVFTGDLFNKNININDNEKEKIKELLKKTSAKIGKYAILGDNDEFESEETLKNADFKILKNENIPIYYKGNVPIYISGIPSISKKEHDITTAFQKEDNNSYQILLAHEPIIFDEVKKETNLVLAGHSLGGLIHLPLIGEIVKFDNTGKYVTSSENKLYVSTGIGTDNLSLRFLNPPSITLYRLYNQIDKNNK